MANEIDYATIESLLAPQTQALQALAMRPQKTSAYITTTTTPYARENMIENRDRIGLARQELDNALKGRETIGYSLANALASVPQQQGYGSWLTDFARGLGTGATGRTNARIDRMQKAYENEMKDLAEILAFDKAMGETQVQNQIMGYDQMAYGTGGKGAGQQNAETVPLTGRPDWDYWIKNWDPDRPTELAYRGQSGIGRYLSNKFVGKHTGSATANAVRQDFDTFTGKNLLKIGRDALKGSGPITDFEDKKYTNWLNEAKDDPVALKDAYVRMVQDVSKKNNWSDMQRRNAYEILGLTSDAADLLPAQIKQDPMRVRNLQPQVKSQPQQMQIGRFSVTVEE